MLQQAEREARQFRLLYGIASLALARFDLDDILRGSLELLAKELGADAAEIWVVDEASQTLRLETLHGIDQPFLEIDRLRIGEGLPGLALQERRAVFSAALRSDPNFLRRGVIEAGFTAFGAIPMECMGTVPGVLCVAAVYPDTLSGPVVQALTEVASLLGLVLTMHELQQQRRTALVKLDGLGARDVVHRALHDFVLQALFALGLELRSLQVASDADRARLAKISGDLGMVVRDVRSLLLQLEQEPSVSRSPEGLRGRIDALIAMRGSGPVWGFEFALDDVEIDPRLEVELYLIVRELVANVFAHARAEHASLAVRAVDGSIEVEVQDDGVGFAPAGVGEHAVGLAATTRRLQALGGTLTIESSPGHGARLLGQLPHRPD